jgi:hypothetical protein
VIQDHRFPITAESSAGSDHRNPLAGHGPCSPSFRISRGIGQRAPGFLGSDPLAGLRLDRINSSEVLRSARSVYFHYLSGAVGGQEPLGVVMTEGAGRGRVVFDTPVLLPHEQFVPIDLLRNRNGSGRRNGRNGIGRPQG